SLSAPLRAFAQTLRCSKRAIRGPNNSYHLEPILPLAAIARRTPSASEQSGCCCSSPVEQAEHRKGSRGVSRDGVRARARAVVFMRAGEFGSRGAALRSAGDRAAFARRSDRGV